MISVRALSRVAKHSSYRLPRLAVFDLDHTLWPFGVDTFCFTPPYHLCQTTGKVIDMSAKHIEHFEDTPRVLQYLHSIGVPVAVASRTKYPYGANALLDIFRLSPYIRYFEIYPGQKVKHFGRLRDQTGVEFEEMIFFDDEHRNIVDVTGLGVFSVLVDHNTGATESVVKESLDKFAQQAPVNQSDKSFSWFISWNNQCKQLSRLYWYKSFGKHKNKLYICSVCVCLIMERSKSRQK